MAQIFNSPAIKLYMQSAPGSLAIDFSEGFAAKLRLLGAPQRTHNEHEHIRAEAKRLKSDWPDAWDHYKHGPYAHAKFDYFNLLWYFADKYCKHRVHVEDLYHKTLQSLTKDENAAFKLVHDKEKQFCERHRLHFQDNSHHKILHALLRCVRHMHPENIRRVQKLFLHNYDVDALKRGLQSCIKAEIELGSSVLEAYDYRYLYCMTHDDNHLVGVLCRYLAELPKEHVILLEWCGSWKNQLMFWYYEKGLGHHLLKYKKNGFKKNTNYEMLQFNGTKKDIYCGSEDKTISQHLQALEPSDIHSFLKYKWNLQSDSGFKFNHTPVSWKRIHECDAFLENRYKEFLARRKNFLALMNYSSHHSQTYIAQLESYGSETKLSNGVQIPKLQLKAFTLGVKSWADAARGGDAVEDERYRNNTRSSGPLAPASGSHRAHVRPTYELERSSGTHGDERGGYSNNSNNDSEPYDPYGTSSWDREGTSTNHGKGWGKSGNHRRWNGYSEEDVEWLHRQGYTEIQEDENGRYVEYGHSATGYYVDVYTPRGITLVRQDWVDDSGIEGAVRGNGKAVGNGSKNVKKEEKAGNSRAARHGRNNGIMPRGS